MYNRKQVKAEAKKLLSLHFGLGFGVIVVYTLIVAAAAYVPAGSLILAGAMSVGLAIVMLEITRGWKVEFADMFKGFKNFGTNCLAGVLVQVYTALWTLLFIIPGIVKMYSYSMTYYILADHPEMSANEAISASRIMMDGHKFDLFILELSFFWWHVLGIITCGIAYIYILPYMMASYARFYDAIKDEKRVIPEPTAPVTE